tara:strand:- start:6474 stop:8063 length:1590 start_codon:yes stop_codon:yes gene_type:complete
MSDLDKAIDNFFGAEKITLKTLFEEVEKAMEFFDTKPLTEQDQRKPGGRFSYSIPIPKLIPTEAWGDPDSQSRQEIAKIFAAVTGGDNMKARIQSVNSFLDTKRATGRRSQTRILNMMMIIEALQATLNDYNEASAGFVFEAFMAALTGGFQESGRVGGTLPIEDFATRAGENVSLKLLGPDTPIHGSFTNLMDYLFIRGGEGLPEIKYLIAFKLTIGGGIGEGVVERLQIFDFMITRDNVVDLMIGTGNAGVMGNRADELKAAIEIFKSKGAREGQAALAKVLVANLIPNPDKKGKKMKDPKDPGVPGYTVKGMFYKNYDKLTGDVINISNPEHICIDPDEPDPEKAKIPDTPEGRERCKAIERNIKLQKGSYAALSKKAAKYDQPTIPDEEQPESMTESFHAREKRLMKWETQQMLLEAQAGPGDKSQWGITRTQMDANKDLAATDYHGEVNLSQENIDELVEIYSGILGEQMIQLLELTKSFTENVGRYFSSEDRTEGQAANTEAQTQGSEIITNLKADPIKQDIE